MGLFPMASKQAAGSAFPSGRRDFLRNCRRSRLIVTKTSPKKITSWRCEKFRVGCVASAPSNLPGAAGPEFSSFSRRSLTFSDAD
jgi:hypothetical protein